MGKQQIRQQARQTARNGALRRRREREQRERRLIDLAAQVLVAVAERDQAVAQAEQRVGVALREFTEAGVAVEFVKEHMTFTGKDSPMQQLMLSLLGAVAERGRSSASGSGRASSWPRSAASTRDADRR